MDDAQALFRDGVLALKEQRDVARARQLITQSLKLDPNNEMAWLWLSRTTDDPARQLQCVDRALKINPANEQALAIRQKLVKASTPASSSPFSSAASTPSVSPTPSPSESGRSLQERLKGASVSVEKKPTPAPAAPPPPVYEVHDLVTEEQFEPLSEVKTQRDKLTPAEEQKIQNYLAAAEKLLVDDDDMDEEGAIEQLVYALQIQVDHPQALQRAVRQLHKMRYYEDAQELLKRAIDAGTPSISIYLTAIDINRQLANYGIADELRERVVMMEATDEATVLKVVEGLINDVQTGKAMELLEKAIEMRPNSHALLMRMAEILEDQGRKSQAMGYLERAARAAGGKGRKRADQGLQSFTPVITDQERGSIPLALREAVGVGIAFVLLAWQDSGLNLVRLNASHWLGVGLSLVGGYFFVTAFSSPQQKGLAKLLGGKVPAKPEGGKFFEEVEVKPWEDHVALPSGPLQHPTSLPILPSWARLLFALIGIAILAFAFYLVFGNAIKLLLNPVEPTFIPNVFDLIEPVE